MINFGFDDVITTNEDGLMDVPYPNLYSKDMYDFDMNTYLEKYKSFPINNSILSNDDFLFLNSRSICFNMNWDLYDMKKDTVDNFIEKDEFFFYPFLLWQINFFREVKPFLLPDKILNRVKLKKCKFIMFFITEPWFMYDYAFKWLSDFSKLNNLEKDDFIFVSSNLKSNEEKEKYIKNGLIEDNHTIIEFNYFFHRLWFFPHKFHENYSKEIYDNTLDQHLKLFKEMTKEKHFLCFNRKAHDHRIYIFAELMSNPKLIGKSHVTLGSRHLFGPLNFSEGIRRVVNPNYKHGYERLCDFIDNYDSSVDFKYDVGLDDEQSININVNAHSRAFCNIVTETQIVEETMFFSEKIIKPIFAVQPFIIIGCRGSLKKLKEFGFKTFDRWWDESYDDAMYIDRFEKIVETLEFIASWDEEKIKNVMLEMEETLIHNYKMLTEDKSTKMFFNELLKYNK
jgi:hypothetical protein